ncbi:hypothetical protein HC256_006583 [Beauveria bassiana]|nr:hypothetical protein HC256_006583 [Beauveria bassiana]
MAPKTATHIMSHLKATRHGFVSKKLSSVGRLVKQTKLRSSSVELRQAPSSSVELSRAQSSSVELRQDPSSSVELSRTPSSSVKLSQAQSNSVKLRQAPQLSRSQARPHRLLRKASPFLTQ